MSLQKPSQITRFAKDKLIKLYLRIVYFQMKLGLLSNNHLHCLKLFQVRERPIVLNLQKI